MRFRIASQCYCCVPTAVRRKNFKVSNTPLQFPLPEIASWIHPLGRSDAPADPEEPSPASSRQVSHADFAALDRPAPNATPNRPPTPILPHPHRKVLTPETDPGLCPEQPSPPRLHQRRILAGIRQSLAPQAQPALVTNGKCLPSAFNTEYPNFR